MRLLIIFYIIFLPECVVKPISQKFISIEDSCLKSLIDTLPKLNLLTIKALKEKSNSTVFIDSNEFNISTTYLKNNSILRINGFDQYYYLLNDSFYYKNINFDESVFYKSFPPKKYIKCDYNLYSKKAMVNDLYFKFSSFLLLRKHKIILVQLELKGDMTYHSEILAIFDDKYKILKLIYFDSVN